MAIQNKMRVFPNGNPRKKRPNVFADGIPATAPTQKSESAATPTPGSKPSVPPGLAKKPGQMAPGQYKHQQAKTGPYRLGGPRSTVVGPAMNPVSKPQMVLPDAVEAHKRQDKMRPNVQRLPGSPEQAPNSAPLAARPARPLVASAPPRGLYRGRGRKKGLRRRFPG